MGIKIQFLTYYFVGGGGGAVWLGGSFGHLLILLWWNLFPLVTFSLFVVVFVGGGGGGGVYVPKFYLCNKHFGHLSCFGFFFLWWSLFLLVGVVHEGMLINVPKFYLCNKRLVIFRVFFCGEVCFCWLLLCVRGCCLVSPSFISVTSVW